MSHFQDKTYLVTGASSGIGLATTRALLAQGAKVAAVGLPDRLLDDAKRQLSGAVIFIEADVSESQQVDSAFARAEAELGPLSGAFNAAGISSVAPIAETSDELWQRLIQVNLTGTFHFARAAARTLSSNGGGSLVCTASELSLVGQAGYTRIHRDQGRRPVDDAVLGRRTCTCRRPGQRAVAGHDRYSDACGRVRERRRTRQGRSVRTAWPIRPAGGDCGRGAVAVGSRILICHGNKPCCRRWSNHDVPARTLIPHPSLVLKGKIT